MKVKPNPAMLPYTASPVAAPKPEAIPLSLPSARVRRMHKTLIGPTGMAIEKPMTNPLSKKAISIVSLINRKLVRGTRYTHRHY